MLCLLLEKLDGNSPLKRMKKGYAYVTEESGKAILSVDEIKVGGDITLRLSDGKIKAKVTEKEKARI